MIYKTKTIIFNAKTQPCAELCLSRCEEKPLHLSIFALKKKEVEPWVN